MKIDSISSLAKFILSSECKSIGILTGAGVSVASGIPDFRSVGGLYDTLQPDLITATPAQRSMNEIRTNVRGYVGNVPTNTIPLYGSTTAIHIRDTKTTMEGNHHTSFL